MDRLSSLIRQRAASEGRSESPHALVSYFRASQPSQFRKHQGWSPSLSVVAQGRKVARLGGRELTYEPQRALLVTGPAVYHSAVLDATPDAPYQALALSLPSDLVVRTLWALVDAGESTTREPEPAVVVPLDSALSDALGRLVLSLDHPLDQKLLFPLCLEEVVVRVLRTEAAATLRDAVRRDGDAGRVVKAMELLETRYAEPWSVADLAAEVGMSVSHFAHRFRAWARVSPIQYQKQLRLYRARELLVERGLRVGEAAREVGYANASTFSREFRGFFQSAPGDLLRSLSPQERHKSPQKPALARSRPAPTF